ncbi:MAG: response regulator transcription factor [Moheibacter sp.]
MKNSLYVYFAINNLILQKGIESIIALNYETDVEFYSFEDPSKLFELDYFETNVEHKVLIYDTNLVIDNSNLLLFNLLKKNPLLKVLVLLHEYDQYRIKTFFNMGVLGVFNKNIFPNDLMNVLYEVESNKKSLAPAFREQVIRQFCRVDNTFNGAVGNELIEVNEEEIYFADELYGLTRREKEILCLICNGKNSKEISEELYISRHTAETHRRNLLTKLDARNTAEMVKVAVMNRLVSA